MAEEKLNTKDDETSLKELILKIKEWYSYLLTKWKIILIAGVIGGALGLTYAILKKPVYTAETTFVLEDGDSGGGGLGQYAGLASMAGIDLGGGGGGIFQGDNILELYKSRRMIQATLLSKDTFNGKIELLINHYISFNHLREKWEKKPETKNLKFTENFTNKNRAQDSVMSKIVDDFNENYLEVSKPDKKLSIISVKFKSKDELFAKAFTDNIVQKVNDFYVQTKTKKSALNLAILQHQADSIKNVLFSGISGVASAVDANPNSNPAFQTLRVPSQRKQLEVQANGAAYQEILKNLEIAKVSFRRDQPLIQVIDQPILPLNNDKLGKIKGILLSGTLFGFFTILFLIFNKIIHEISN